jgi:hypothetical protein
MINKIELISELISQKHKLDTKIIDKHDEQKLNQFQIEFHKNINPNPD